MRLLIAAMFVIASLSGCASEEPVYVDPGPADPQAEPDPGEDEPGEDPGTDPDPEPEPEPKDTPPALAIDLSVLEGDVPFVTNLTVNVSDVDGDAVSWVAVVNGTEVATGDESGVANVTIREVGNHTLVVTATAAGQSVNASAVLVGRDPPPSQLDFDDSDADGDIDMLDITHLRLELTDAGLEATITLQDLTYPSERGNSLWWYAIFVDGERYDSELGFDDSSAASEDHSRLFDVKDEASLGYEFTTWASDTDTVWILIPHSELEEAGLSAPYEVYVASMVFPASETDDTAERDVAPEAGPAILG